MKKKDKDEPPNPELQTVKDVQKLLDRERLTDGADRAGWTGDQIREYLLQQRSTPRALGWERLTEILREALNDNLVRSSPDARHIAFLFYTSLSVHGNLQFSSEDVVRVLGFEMVRQQGDKPIDEKTLLYLAYAQRHGSDNNMAMEQIHCDAPRDDDGKSVFFWRDYELIDRKAGAPITPKQMKAQLQRAKSHHAKAKKTLG